MAKKIPPKYHEFLSLPIMYLEGGRTLKRWWRWRESNPRLAQSNHKGLHA